jgi:hypothetical protein
MWLMRISFSILLPLAGLAAWAAMLFTPSQVPVVFTGAHSLIRTDIPEPSAPGGAASASGASNTPLSDLFQNGGNTSNYVLKTISLPGVITGALISLMTTGLHAVGSSSGSLDVWETLASPVYCLPFWWLAGCGLDSWFREKRLGTITIFAGTLTFLLFVVLSVRFIFERSGSQMTEDTWAVWSMLLWTAAFATVPLGWLRRRSTRAVAPADA